MEVFYSGKWGTICDNSWDINDATVVCRQLGYKFGVRALRGSYISNGTGQIWLNEVACTGSEQNLSSCPHNGWGNKNCGHGKDAGVECSSTGTVKIILKIELGFPVVNMFNFYMLDPDLVRVRWRIKTYLIRPRLLTCYCYHNFGAHLCKPNKA